jgi:hypothetical protein
MTGEIDGRGNRQAGVVPISIESYFRDQCATLIRGIAIGFPETAAFDSARWAAKIADSSRIMEAL